MIDPLANLLAPCSTFQLGSALRAMLWHKLFPRDVTGTEGSVTDIATYTAYVEDCARRAFNNPADSEIILNRSPSHASVLIRRLIESGRSSIDVLTGDLYEEVWGPTVLAAFRRFLAAGPDRRVRVLFDQSKRAKIDETGNVWHPGLAEIKSDGGHLQTAMRAKSMHASFRLK
jgi:hypothetical protein